MSSVEYCAHFAILDKYQIFVSVVYVVYLQV